MAGLWCTFWHPNQTERHFESVAEGQVACLQNQAAYQLQETSQHKNILLSQIESLRVETLQEIHNEYQASYIAIIEEFSKSHKIHEESLLALSFFWVYGKAIINAEELAQRQAILQDNQKLKNLAAEKEDLINSFSTNYRDSVKEETERFEAFVVEHEAALKALILDRDTKFAALNEFMDAQIQSVEHQYDADIQAIETAARNVINQVNDDLRNCLKRLDSQRNSMALNGALIIGASLVACAVPVLLPTVGSFAIGAVQISAATTGLSAADNLFNGNGAVGVNFTVDVTNYVHKPYAPPSYKSPALEKDIVLPDNYESKIELNPYSHNRISSQVYSNGNIVTPQKTNISITNLENKKATYQAPKVENKPVSNIERPEITPPKTGVINWSRMAWRSITQDNSPEVISWQQENRNRLPTAASFFDGIANSKTQRFVNAFADEFAGRPVMFVKEELSLRKQGAQTKTAKFVENTAGALKEAQEFAVQDVARFRAGDTMQTQIFFETVGQFIDADIERFRDGQATVIGTAIAEDFKALGNMTPEQLAAHLGHEAGDAFLFFFAGAGLQAGGRAVTKTMDAAITLAKDFRATRTFQSPLLFQFKEGTLYSGFPFDAIETQKMIIGKTAELEVIAKDIAQAYVQPKLPGFSEKLTKIQIVDYLQNIDTVPLKQLTIDLERLGFELLEYRPDQKIYKFSHVKNNGLRRAGKSKDELELITDKAKANLKSANVMVEIHCDAKSGAHMHITDTNGNVYDKNLNNLTAKVRKDNPGWHENKVQDKVVKLPEAHIKISEFVELNMRPENV